ncbi:hypothetical protein [Flavobacterium kingsejongi]|uniref:Uncharacterized protein n=1 Tax=Flavobacterium kingsejongi TaxID=1678728 RepID=A0A2S1LRD3_9FLAO|nr:hypothetical protein [Flavobacterium kingsejongi]AWG26248.1 hypothetical protein FK004_13925 [Flavobacterium kingsejongi]
MKKTLYSLLLLVFLISCKKEPAEPQKVPQPGTLHQTEILQDSLTAEQLQKVTKIQAVFANVYPVSLEESITNFERDLNPDNEIRIWLAMADAYEKYLSGRTPKPELKEEKEIFKLLLSRSMMPEEEALENTELKIVTPAEARKVLSYYNDKASPILVK